MVGITFVGVAHARAEEGGDLAGRCLPLSWKDVSGAPIGLCYVQISQLFFILVEQSPHVLGYAVSQGGPGWYLPEMASNLESGLESLRRFEVVQYLVFDRSHGCSRFIDVSCAENSPTYAHVHRDDFC